MPVIFRHAFIWLCLAAGLSLFAQKPTPPDEKAKLPDATTITRLVINNWWETNCYIFAGKTGQAIIIDPGDEMEFLGNDRYRVTGNDAKRIYDFLQKNKLKLKYMVLSHGHLDHIGAIGCLKKMTGAQILMHEGDVRPKGDPFEGCPKDTRMFEGGLPKVDRLLKDGELLSLDGMTLRVMHVPGHSPGSICLYTTQKGQHLLFSGDALFYHSVGRTNFKDGSGDEKLLYDTIRKKLFTLPEDTIVMPGHYQFTTIGEEKAHNPFLNPPAPPATDAAKAQPAAEADKKN